MYNVLNLQIQIHVLKKQSQKNPKNKIRKETRKKKTIKNKGKIKQIK